MDKPTIIRHLADADTEEQVYFERVLLGAILAAAHRGLVEHPPADLPEQRQWFFVTGLDY